MKFLARNLALCGAVCLLLAEVTGETRTIFAGVPTLDDNNPKNMLQLSGTNNFIIFLINAKCDLCDLLYLRIYIFAFDRRCGIPVI